MLLTPETHLLLELERLDCLLLSLVSQMPPDTVPSAGGRRGLTNADVLPLLDDAAPVAEDQAEIPDIDTLAERHALLSRELEDRVRATLEAGHYLPLVALAQQLKLDLGSVLVVVLAIATHIDRKYERVFAYLQENTGATWPTVELALRLLASNPEEAFRMRGWFDPDAPLVLHGVIHLLEREGGGSGSELARSLTLTPRMVRLLLGRPGAEPVVEAMRAREPLPDTTAAQGTALERFGKVWNPHERPGAVGIIRSADPEALLEGARQLAAGRACSALLVDLSRPAAAVWPMAERVRAAFQEAWLTAALLAMTGFDDLPEPLAVEAVTWVAAQIEHYEGAVLLFATRELELHRELRRRPVLVLEDREMTSSERLEYWQTLAPGVQSADRLETLSSHYRLGTAQMRDAVAMAHWLEASRLNGQPPEGADALTAACQAQSRHALGTLAQRLPPRQRWQDLILPPSSHAQLREMVRFLRYRDLVFDRWGMATKAPYGRGLTSLFAGPPGTGKTMAASIIAGTLGLEIFRIDLSGVVSKYIGETEKNLDRVFRAARRSNAILFFDEADALFGKRTEVKDAHDRYANIEVSYLLQKMEEFDGITILATNFRKNLDAAFLRRIIVLVEFPAPDVAHRRRLWQTLIPDEMPREESLDFDFLAEKFELAGGHIKNAVQTGALLAAADGGELRLGHLLVGVRRELQKQGKLPSFHDFGRYSPLLQTVLEREDQLI